MEALKEILINYWKPLVGFLFALLGFILLCVKKRSINPIVELIYEAAVKAVIDTENAGVRGAKDKLDCATDIVIGSIKAVYPDINAYLYEPLIHSVIEAILSTPQKKGGNSNG